MVKYPSPTVPHSIEIGQIAVRLSIYGHSDMEQKPYLGRGSEAVFLDMLTQLFGGDLSEEEGAARERALMQSESGVSTMKRRVDLNCVPAAIYDASLCECTHSSWGSRAQQGIPAEDQSGV